jgi:hypothetical protein
LEDAASASIMTKIQKRSWSFRFVKKNKILYSMVEARAQRASRHLMGDHVMFQNVANNLRRLNNRIGMLSGVRCLATSN